MRNSAPEHDEVLRVRRWVNTLRGRIEALGGMLDACGQFLEQRARVRVALRERGLPALTPDPDKLVRGIPLLVDESLEPYSDAFLEAGKRLIPAMSTAFPGQAGEMLRVLAGIESRALDPTRSIEALLRGDSAALADLAQGAFVAAPSLAFAVGQIMRPIMEEAGRDLSGAIKDSRWRKGYCPVCGAGPEMSVFRSSGQDDDFLKSHGGQRWLRCSRCAALWRHKRHSCPACDNEEHDTLRYYTPEGGGQGERVDVCLKCKRYVTGIDVRDMVEEPDLDVAALAMLPLDIHIQGQGYAPVAETIWNKLD